MDVGAKVHFKSGKSLILKQMDIKSFYNIFTEAMSKIERFPLVEMDGNIINVFEIEFIEKWYN